MTIAIEILLEPGQILYREGDANDCGYIIETGEVILYNERRGGRTDCERRGPGCIVGELSILTGRPRAVTVEATTNCCIYKVSASEIIARYQSLDPILRACIDTSIDFSARVHQTSQPALAEVPLASSTLQNADALIAQLRFEQDVQKGLQKNEFQMVYQPIVSLADAQIVGCEALMRWCHPTLGFVPPDKFIAVAETTGFIGKLTDFALEQACATLCKMQETAPENADLFMSVNVSGADIGRRGFLDYLAHLVEFHDLQPHNIKLEVTETALIPTGDDSETALTRLKKFGCGISIDDFGTGYSNLGYLKSLPLTALKIDRAFAGDACQNAVSRSIVKMLVGLGRELDIDIIAEGLETSQDVDTLRGLGCRLAQGFYFHKPMPVSGVIDALTHQNDQRSSVA